MIEVNNMTDFTKEDLLKVFNTMSFNGGNVKEVKLIDNNTIYLVMFNQPDLLFHFRAMDCWSLETVVNHLNKV